MDDPYYQTLPFSLNQEQLDYDFIVFGTNLQACMYAAHMSKIQKKRGLMVELEKGYGGDIRTLSLKQLHQFMTTKGLSSQENAVLPFKAVLPEEMVQRNVEEVNKRKQTAKGLRGYNIDLQPRFFCGSSLACEMLKQANMDQYMDFRVVKKVLFVLNGKLEEVPLNLKTIMNAHGLSLFERKDLYKGVHQLVKIYYKYHSVEVDNNSTNEFDKDTDVNQQLYSLFCEDKDNHCQRFLLKTLNNKQKLYNMVMHGICGYPYKKPPPFVQEQYSCLQMLKKFGRFVKSCGVYGQTPYLYVDNGIGDIPQAFCRISSIFGTISILHPRIEINSILKKEEQNDYEIETNLAPGSRIQTKIIKFTEPYFNYLNPLLKFQQPSYSQLILRVVSIRKLPQNFPHQGPIIIHSFEDPTFVNPVTCFLFDSVSSSTPDDEYMLQFMTIIQSESEEHVNSQTQAILKLAQTLFGTQDTVYTAAYIQRNSYSARYSDHMMRNDWNFDLERTVQLFEETVGEHKKYFKDDAAPHQQDEDDGYYEVLLKKLDNLKQRKQQEVKDQKGEGVPPQQTKEQREGGQIAQMLEEMASKVQTQIESQQQQTAANTEVQQVEQSSKHQQQPSQSSKVEETPNEAQSQQPPSLSHDNPS